MALVTKSTSEQGQISIFFSASLVVLVTIIAFVINIGLFVKAKINLQNATDAAAFSGAAVQARQLTKIAYLNWEMRNIYKEWMYKYYVIGNLNIDDVNDAGDGNDNGPVSYRMRADRNAITGSVVKDRYNIPAVCIHIEGSETNICRHYAIPGLPEFGSTNLPGAEEASRAFMDTLIGTKIDDCIDRTKLNMLVATTWAYNVLGLPIDDTLTGRGPAILSNRQGAWPKAVELAMRIRNLEKAMNRPAETQRVCNQPGVTDKISCSKSISQITDENMLGNERIVKAFYAGYRNIGGNYEQDEMKNSFTITEIPPRTVTNNSITSASNLLIPADRIYGKQFVDLKLMMVNYAIFYAAMIPRADDKTSGACDVSKAAIPVPGYPMGYYKNPDLVTYYAVRGEAVFEGMFNPFNDDIKMTAYAAAKPFGGRIGPMLFTQPKGRPEFYGRTDGLKKRSVPYMTTLDVVGTPKRGGGRLVSGEYIPGVPLPVNGPGTMFWLDEPGKPIGGLVTDSQGVQFGIPNLVYDYQVPYRDTGYTLKEEPIHTLASRAEEEDDKEVGLFSKYQLAKFKGNGLGATVSPETLDHEIARVRAPTLYEAGNYLVPTPFDLNLANNMDSFGWVSGEPEVLPNGVKRYSNYVYAPLYTQNGQADVLWSGPGPVVRTIFEFMRTQKSGIDKYRISLNQAARAIFTARPAGVAEGSIPKYEAAAKGVADINFGISNNDQMPSSCSSISGQFLYFYYGGSTSPEYVNGITDVSQCPKPLGDLLLQYFESPAADQTFRSTHYKFDYSWYEPNFENAPVTPKSLGAFSAYVPGPFTGVDFTGVFQNPIPGSSITETMRRNSYSTKFIPLDSVKGGPGYSEQQTSNFLIFSEGDVESTNLQVKQDSFTNPLSPQEIGAEDLNSIKH